MDTKNIGKLEKVPLRDIWKGEAKDFTRWLEENIDTLNEALDLSLTSAEREKHTGPFNVDLTAEDAEGNRVVIECQLEKTDHDHLGKLVTYLSTFDAKIAIWICKDPRKQHAKAVDWLNESTPPDISFYLVKVEGVRIGSSPAAPLFTVICRPSEETTQIAQEKKELAERHIKRREFWSQLLQRSKPRTKLHANISPGTASWIGTGAGKSGLSYNYVITKDSGQVELYIDKPIEEINKQIFDRLHANKEQIEKEFGANLSWERLDARRASRITKRFHEAGLKHEENWSELQGKMIDAMMRLEKSLKGHIAKLEV